MQFKNKAIQKNENTYPDRQMIRDEKRGIFFMVTNIMIINNKGKYRKNLSIFYLKSFVDLKKPFTFAPALKNNERVL